MKVKCRIEFLSDYLQARFSEESQKQVEMPIKAGPTKIKINDPKTFLYQDDKGCFIPAIQIKSALANSGKDFKVKSRRTNYANFVKAKIFVEPEKIYLNKRKEDEVLVSYAKRKDGFRVPVAHPVFKKGTQVTFYLDCLDEDNLDFETFKKLVENAGLSYALGARRPEFGRFKVLEFNLI